MAANDGYFTSLDYVYRYQYMISPVNLQLCLLSRGYASPFDKPYRYLELGFGRGASLSAHAATSDNAEFWGVDLNVNAAVSVARLAAEAGVDVRVYGESFKIFCARTDLPEFDVIVFHGVWSWVSAENRALVVDFVSRKLATEGIFYISYNTPLGKWPDIQMLRHLMKTHYARASSAAQSSAQRIEQAVHFMRETVAVGLPDLVSQAAQIADKTPEYLAGEYFNEDWELSTYSDISEALKSTKLSFAAHAGLTWNFDFLCVDDNAKKELAKITDPILAEHVRDVLANHEFRADIWVKGIARLNEEARVQQLRKIRFILPKAPEECDLNVMLPRGETVLPAVLYGSVLRAFEANGYQPQSADTLAEWPLLQAFSHAQLTEALLVLASLRYVFAVQPEDVIVQATPHTRALNNFILEQAVYNDSMPYVVSPVTGCAIELTRFQRLFLLAREEGAASSDEWAMLAWQLLSQQAGGIQVDGQLITDAEKAGVHLKTLAANFAQQRLPFLQVLGIVSE